MKRLILAIGAAIILSLILWRGSTFVGHGGLPSSGPTGDILPPHIQYVNPADGDSVVTSHGFCVQFNYQAGRGLGDNPQTAIRFYIDGVNVTDSMFELVELEYPDPLGEPCFRQSEPLSTRWHTIMVSYTDRTGEEFNYSWRFQVVGE